MKLADARIGYQGYSRDLGGPGDRRRFVSYSQKRGLHFERAEAGGDYDLVVITHNGDIPGWTARKRRAGARLRFVFELADSYFERTRPAERYVKGLARYALGTDRRFCPDFLGTLIAACEAADAVICTTDEQREAIRRYNPHVFTTFDDFSVDLGPPKTDYRRGPRLRLVWEGQSATLDNLQSLRPVLNALADRVELHVVSDPSSYRWFDRYGAYRSARKLAGIRCPVHFHAWQRETFSDRIVAADLAIIPIDPASAFARGKPENKLVMMWKLGMPVLASATPAYARAMKGAGVDMLCGSEAEWRAQLERWLAASADELASAGRTCRAYAERAYSDEQFLRRFDQAFEAAGFTIGAAATG